MGIQNGSRSGVLAAFMLYTTDSSLLYLDKICHISTQTINTGLNNLFSKNSARINEEAMFLNEQH